MSGDDQEPSMVFQPWRFEPLGKNSETGHRRCDFDGDEWAFPSVTVIVPVRLLLLLCGRTYIAYMLC
ncbi:hypothetical protein ACROYT_G031316 [Oculina patagonica]